MKAGETKKAREGPKAAPGKEEEKKEEKKPVEVKFDPEGLSQRILAMPMKAGVEVARVQVKVDPPAEWAQMLEEAWRINRDFFYDPGFHGADWPAMRKKYAAFLPDLSTRNDLFRVVQWMLSELSVGHSYQSPGDSAFEPETIPGGLLGADYETPADVIAGRDPQLEKAIEIVLAALAEDPPVTPKRPPLPLRARPTP